MPRFKVTRVWYVKAETVSEAIDKAKNWDHVSVSVRRVVNNELVTSYRCYGRRNRGGRNNVLTNRRS